MTRSQGGPADLSGAGKSMTGGERAALYSSKLPRGTPEIIAKNTVIVTDSNRILSWNKDERQRHFNVLVRRYKHQLLHGCQNPNCITPTCLSFRKRVAEAPFRKFTELSARTLACYLASQDHPERGLCRNEPARHSEPLTEGGRQRASSKRSSISAAQPSTYGGRDNRSSYNSDKAPRAATMRSSDDEPVDTQHQSPDALWTAEVYNGQGVSEALRTKPLKDPKSITQNLFDTLSLRMLEWLPLRRSPASPSPHSTNGEEAIPPQEPPHFDTDHARERSISSTPPSARKSTNLRNGRQTNVSSISTSVNTQPTTLEVKVPAQPVKRLSLGELEHWKQPPRYGSGDILPSERKPVKRVTTNNTPTSQSLPSPPALKHRPQKHRHMGSNGSIPYGAELGHGPQASWEIPKAWREAERTDTTSPRSPLEGSPGGSSPNVDRQSQSNLDIETQTQSLSLLSKEIVDDLEKLMYDTEDDENAWREEMQELESKGSTEPGWQFATLRQRQVFPFIAQSLFFVLSDPDRLLRSFRSNSHEPCNRSESKSFSDLDVQSLENAFRTIYRIYPWETTMHNLWMCLEKLFVPPKGFSISSKHHRRFIRAAVLPERASERPASANSYISDRKAAYISVVALFALVSSVPQLDPQTWKMINRVRSAGTVISDYEMRQCSEHTSQLIVHATDRFEHDLALRLVSRLARVVSARLAFHEISKTKSYDIDEVGKQEKSNVLHLIMAYIRRCSHEVISVPYADRPVTIPMVVVEWLRSLLLKEWDGKPEISTSGAAGGAVQLLISMFQYRNQLGLKPEDFHSSFLSDRLDPLEMPVEWLRFVPNNRTMHLLTSSFLFPPSSVVVYFRALNYSTMSKSYEIAMTTSRHLSQTAFSGSITIDDDIGLITRLKNAISTYLVLVVRRDNVLTDALDQLWRREKRELMRPLKVRMGMDEGEEGIDHGGVQQEFFRVVVAEALSPSYGMFTVDSETGASWFQPCSFEPLYKFELLGLLMSLAIYNGLTLPVNFPVMLYRKLLDWRVGKTSIRGDWPSLARGLDDLLSWTDGDVGDIFMRTYEFSFEVFETVVSVDMTTVDRNDPWPAVERNVSWDRGTERSGCETDGSDTYGHSMSMLEGPFGESRPARRSAHVPGILKGSSSKTNQANVPPPLQQEAPLVTNQNRRQFVKDYVFWLTDKSIRPQYEAFARGFYTCLDRTALSIFTPEALKTVVEGIQEIDIDELERHARYEGGFEPDDQIIRDFWDVAKGYSQEKRGQLLEFVTASDRVPVNGISSIMFVVQKNGTGDDRLPTSLTCFGRLLLPAYSSREVLEDKLEKALENAKGFGVA